MFDKNAELHDLTRSGAPPTAWYERRGSGPPLALLPGGPGMASDYLAPVADLLSDAFEVILVDPPGCGRSPGIEVADLPALLEAIDEVRAALGLDQWLIGGHSFGADLALAYAVELPRRTLSVLAISPTGVQDDRDWHRTYESGRAAGSDQVAESAFQIDTETHAAGLAAWRRYIKQPELLRRIADLPARYVAVVGSEEIRPSWPVEQVAMLAPRGEVTIIDGAGHCPWWTHPIELREAALRLTVGEPDTPLPGR